MEIGDAVYVTENFRARGKVGGWKEHTWEGTVTKVNRTTVEVRRDHGYGNFMFRYKVKKEQVKPR